VPKPTVPTDFQPIISANYGNTPAQIVMVFEFWISLALIIIWNKPFYDYMFDGNWWFLILVPLSIYGLLFQFAGLNLLISWVIWKILCLIEPPKEGEFPRNGREFHFYCWRFWIQFYSLFIARAMPLPWTDMFCFRMFGCKIGKNVVLYDSWIDMEFVEVGDYVMLSLNAALISHCIYKDKFLVKRVVVRKNGIVGAEAIIGPGTVLEEGAILGAGCTTALNQVLAPYRIHVGNPASISMPIKVVEDNKPEVKTKPDEKPKPEENKEAI
jgi:hypothetical protein